MSDRYKIRNEILREYCENNEPKSASIGNPTLISLEDCDIVIDRVIKELTKSLPEKVIQEELALAQLTGFAHASRGFSIKELAESMGLTKEEWIKLKNKAGLKSLDEEDLDEEFGI